MNVIINFEDLIVNSFCFKGKIIVKNLFMVNVISVRIEIKMLMLCKYGMSLYSIELNVFFINYLLFFNYIIMSCGMYIRVIIKFVVVRFIMK